MAEVRKTVLADIIRRVVQAAHPEKIVLFGSGARGTMGPESDIDLLVIKSGVHRRQTAQELYMNLFGVGQAVDVIVVTPEDIEQYRGALGLIIGPALDEGKVVYERVFHYHPVRASIPMHRDVLLGERQRRISQVCQGTGSFCA